MFLFLIIGLIISLIISWIGIKNDDFTIILAGVAFIFVTVFINSFIFPLANKAATYDPTDEIPNCPNAGLSHYEYLESFFSNETRVIEKFHYQNWTNVQTINRPSGGFFGGHDTFITGDCVL